MKKKYRGPILFLVVFMILSLTSDLWWTHKYYETNTSNILSRPSLSFPFGTDSLGRDQFARILFGFKISVFTGVVSTMITVVFAVSYSFIISAQNNLIKKISSRILDTSLALPSLVIIALVSFLIPTDYSILKIFIAISACNWMYLAKLLIGWIEIEKSKMYVEAAKSLGASNLRIMVRHIFPNILPHLIVMTFLQIPYNLLYESYLSFLGLGLKPPFVSFGFLSYEGWKLINLFPYLSIIPGFFLFLTIFSFQKIGEHLRSIYLKE